MKFSIKDFTFTEEILNGKLHFLCRFITLCRSYYYLNVWKQKKKLTKTNPTSNYMFKVNNRNTRTRIEICSNLICSSVFIASIEQVNADWK